MGTHSLIIVRDSSGSTYAVIYQQYDGYLDGIGQLLYRLLKDIRIVNGIPTGEKGDMANGAGCLAARIVAHFKNYVKTRNKEMAKSLKTADGPVWAGGCYLRPPSEFTEAQEEEWNYYVTVHGEDQPIQLMIRTGGEVLYDGNVKNAGSLFKGNEELPQTSFSSSDEELEEEDDGVYTVALITEDGDVEYHDTDNHSITSLLHELLQCPEYDYMQISPFHTMYIPCGDDALDLKVLTKCDENGDSVDITDDDVEQLPDLLASDAEAREDFIANFSGTVIRPGQ